VSIVIIIFQVPSPTGHSHGLNLERDAVDEEPLVLGDERVGGVDADVAPAAQERAVFAAHDDHRVHLQTKDEDGSSEPD